MRPFYGVHIRKYRVQVPKIRGTYWAFLRALELETALYRIMAKVYPEALFFPFGVMLRATQSWRSTDPLVYRFLLKFGILDLRQHHRR